MNRLSIRNRLRAMVGLLILGVGLLAAADVLLMRDTLRQEKADRTRQLVDGAWSVLAHFHDLQARGEMTEAAARAAAIGTVRAMRFDAQGYFWINDLDGVIPRMVMHPTVPELEGRRLEAAAFNRATALRADGAPDFSAVPPGTNLFAGMLSVVRRSGAGFVAYDWPKPLAGGGTTQQLYPKISYVRQFKPWGWMVGSGLYIDDIDRQVTSLALRNLLMTGAIGAVLMLVAGFIARSITRPLAATMEAMRHVEQEAGQRRLPVAGRSEVARLATAFNGMLDRLQVRDAELAQQRDILEEEVQRRTEMLNRTNLQLLDELAQRKLAEQAMRDQRARMRALLDANAESVLLLEPEGGVLDINALGARRFGRTPEDMAGRNFFDLLPPDLAASRRTAMQQVVETGDPMRVKDFRNGIFFDNHIYPVFNETGQVGSVAVYAKDITEQHRIQGVEDIFRNLDTMLMKWRMDMLSVAQLFCDELLPVFGLAGAWIGRAEADGQLALLGRAESGEGSLLAHLDRGELRWDGTAGSCLPAAEVLRTGHPKKLRCPGLLSGGTDRAEEEGHEMLVLPLILRDENWGVLAVYAGHPGQFDDAPLSIHLSTVARRLGVTLESALQQEWSALLDAALSSVGNAVMITDAKANILWANHSFATLTGHAVPDVLGRTPAFLHSGQQDDAFHTAFHETLQAGQPWRGDIVNKRRDGSLFTAAQTITPLLDRTGHVSHFVSIMEDISERKAMEEKIRHAANYDALTGLPNRSLFFDRLSQALALARRDAQEGALLFIDLDHFKDVNDRLGHDAGDRLLAAVAERLHGQVRESDTVARLAGDEFTVILPHLPTSDGALHLAGKILAALALPFEIAGQSVTIEASIGVARFPTDGDTAEKVLNAADHAMYRAKAEGRNGVHLFAPT